MGRKANLRKNRDRAKLIKHREQAGSSQNKTKLELFATACERLRDSANRCNETNQRVTLIYPPYKQQAYIEAIHFLASNTPFLNGCLVEHFPHGVQGMGNACEAIVISPINMGSIQPSDVEYSVRY